MPRLTIRILLTLTSWSLPCLDPNVLVLVMGFSHWPRRSLLPVEDLAVGIAMVVFCRLVLPIVIFSSTRLRRGNLCIHFRRLGLMIRSPAYLTALLRLLEKFQGLLTRSDLFLAIMCSCSLHCTLWIYRLLLVWELIWVSKLWFFSFFFYFLSDVFCFVCWQELGFL